MPELPDVEIFRQVLEKRGLGKKIVAVGVSDPRILGNLTSGVFTQRLVGRKLVEARRHGKHLLAKIENDGWLTLHFGMTGGLEVFPGQKVAPPYSRVSLDFAGGERLAYTNRRMIGRVGLTRDADMFIAEEKLGPDALGKEFTLAQFQKAAAVSRRDVKSFLMDQEIVAGIGNTYADEILFQARLHPKTLVSALTSPQLEALYHVIATVLKAAIKAGIGAEQRTARAPKGFLLPERKKGGHCPRCGAVLALLKSGGRTGYFCPRCQADARA